MKSGNMLSSSQKETRKYSGRRVSSGSTGFKSLLKKIGILASIGAGAHGQVIGEDTCGCSPSTYTFTFDFNLFCPPANVTVGAGVASASCLILPLGNPDTTDLEPVVINAIDIIEIGQDISVIVQENLQGEFFDGDSFDYKSITNTPEEITSSQDIPRAIQLNLIGSNAGGEGLINIFILTFTNNCEIYPVLTENESAGWVILSELGAAEGSVCPISTSVPVPTESPVTPAPQGEGTGAPTPAPTLRPTQRPGSVPTPVPAVPTFGPTDMSMLMNDLDTRALDEAVDKEFGRE